MANVRFHTLAALAARTTASNGDTFDTVKENYGDVVRSTAKNVSLQLRATAKTGTNPTLQVLLQGSADGTNWMTVGSMTLLNNPSVPASEHKAFTGPMPRYLRASWAFGGTDTPGYTFEVRAAFEE
jgi:hypothetical protein